MRKYTSIVEKTEVQNRKLEQIICNKCGKKMELKHSEESRMADRITKAEVFAVSHSWGYGSKFDLETHQFDLCESCYEEWIMSFQIPVQIETYTVG